MINFFKLCFDKILDVYHLFNYGWADYHIILRLILFIIFAFVIARLMTALVFPFIMFVYAHTLLRLWNYLVVESLSELVYILFVSKNKNSKLSQLNERLDKQAQKNKRYINNAHYETELAGKFSYRQTANRRLQKQFSYFINILCGLSIALFIALSIFYSIPFANKPITGDVNDKQETENSETAARDEQNSDETEAMETIQTSQEEQENAAEFPEGTTLVLNKYGLAGAQVRKEPVIADGNRVEAVYGDMQMVYLGESIEDQTDPSLIWHKVKTENQNIGWISGRLVSPLL